MPNFEVFTRRSSPIRKEPLVTIQRKGMFSMNQAAFEALGSPEAVELLYDPEEKIIGLRPIDPEAAHAYPVRTMGNGSSRLVAGTAFATFHGIDTSVARRYNAAMYGNVLGIDLKQEALEVTGPASRSQDAE